MHFVLLWDAVDATIKVKFGMVSNRRVCGEILTYYGYFDYGDDNLVKSFYKASLFESCNGSIREGGDVPLKRSLLDVPFSFYLIIEARLTKFKSKKVNFFCRRKFFPHREASDQGDITYNEYTLNVDITWSQGDGGHIQMHFVLLRDAVEATIKVKFGMGSNRKVYGEIVAYHGEFDYGDDKLVKSFYKASLFESYDGSIREGFHVPLM
nr:arginine--tRNA ligase, chloroplastic/mitochondrial [Tanacetum cinerariifolium]